MRHSDTAISRTYRTAAAVLLLVCSPTASMATSDAPTPAAPVAVAQPSSVEGAAAAKADPAKAEPANAEPAPAQSEPAAAPAAAPKPLPTTLIARINLTSQTMTVQANGKVIHTWKVSSGAPGYATPPGTFKPGWMARSWYSRQYDNAPMPYSVFFNGGIAVHGTMHPGSLGRAASHGCVRLSVANAAVFYRLVSSHGLAQTRIIVQGPQPFSRNVASRSGNQRSASDWVYTPSGQGSRRTIVRYDGYGYVPVQRQQRAMTARSQSPYWARY